MKTAPYSLQEAKEICKEFNRLLGKSFVIEADASIQCIAIAPFEQHHKDRFIAFYFLLNDAEMALQHEYNGLLYDVMVLAQTEDKRLLHESLYTWLAKNNQLDLVDLPALVLSV